MTKTSGSEDNGSRTCPNTEPSRNNLSHPTHCRTYSHPLTLHFNSFQSEKNDQIDPKLQSSSSLTDILNLDFVNIPPALELQDHDVISLDTLGQGGPSSKSSPGSIPPSAMLKYLNSKDQPLTGSSSKEVIEDILVDIGAIHSTSEIAKVLDNFNAILERIEKEEEHGSGAMGVTLTLSSSPDDKFLNGSGLSSSTRIKNSVEAFADLLLSGGMDCPEEDEDLLIIVDENDVETEESRNPDEEYDEDDEELELEEMDDLCPSLDGDREEVDFEGGYESDRPMVRASMRKLRPVKLRPLPSSSNNLNTLTNTNNVLLSEVPPQRMEEDTNLINEVLEPGLVTCLSSPSTNKIVLNSLMDSIGNGSNIGSSVVPLNDPYRQMSSGTRSVSPIREFQDQQAQSSSQIITILHVVNETVSNSSSNNNTNSASVSNSNGSSTVSTTLSPNISGAASLSSSLEIPSSTGLNPSTNNTTESTNATTTGTTGTSNPIGTTTTTTSNNVTTSTTTGTTRRIGATAAARVLRVPSGRWPHRLSSVLALIGCTLGLNNICRFGLLSVQYGANFILQFVFLSIVFGIPLLTFHMSIGQYLSSGIIDMWKISPIFQGIGVGLLISQAMIGLYTAVGVSWTFIYFRDSFVTRNDQYRWGKCVREFRDCDPYQQTVYGYNQTVELSETVPDYFNGVVLQRSSADYPSTSSQVPSSLKFTVAFNLAVVWMLVFVSLSKGLKSYGKVVHGFVLAPVAALFVLAFKMVGLVEAGSTLFGQTAWSEFFFNSQTWVVAAREAFFTWGLLGACVMQVTAHNRHSHPLKSDAVIVIMVTTIVLLLSAFIGNTCLSIITSDANYLQSQQYSYMPSSFESDKSYKFLKVKGHQLPDFQSYNYNHNPFLMGVRILTPEYKSDNSVSGYQVLRLATELFPTAMAILSPSGISPFWTVLFYFTLVLFGIAQQIAIWHCVIKGIIGIKSKVLRSWETTITFFVCGLGYVLGLPLCTETGIFVTYFLDFAIGSGWWIMILYLLELVAVFIVRGAPYCGENIVTVLITGPGRLSRVLAPLISFIWNVIMPVALLVLSIASFKSGNIRELYDWNPNRGYKFWPSWTREVGSLIQLLPILAVPFVAIIQSCRYLSNGPADLFERMQQLYRPNSMSGSSSSSSDRSTSRNSNGGRSEDPPPKYTPPPSYSTATGAKIARFLRNSFRRSLRRLGSPAGGPSSSSSATDNLPPPPNYATVILEIQSQQNQNLSCGVHSMIPVMMQPPPEYEEATQQTSKVISASGISGKGGIYQIPLSQTLGRSICDGSKERSSLRRIASDLTARDIARMLRASFRKNGNPIEQLDIESRETGGITFIANGGASARAAFEENPGPSFVQVSQYNLSRPSLEKIDYDLDMLRALEASTTSMTSSRSRMDNPIAGTSSASYNNNYHPPMDFRRGMGFDGSRNRNSNASTIALISNGCYDFGSDENDILEISSYPQNSRRIPEEDFCLNLGVVNPTFHLRNSNAHSPGGSSLPPHSEA